MITFAIVYFLMFVTPGPGALSLAGVGVAFGWRQGFVYMVGLIVGSKTGTGQLGFHMKYSAI